MIALVVTYLGRAVLRPEPFADRAVAALRDPAGPGRRRRPTDRRRRDAGGRRGPRRGTPADSLGRGGDRREQGVRRAVSPRGPRGPQRRRRGQRPDSAADHRRPRGARPGPAAEVRARGRDERDAIGVGRIGVALLVPGPVDGRLALARRNSMSSATSSAFFVTWPASTPSRLSSTVA